MSKKMFDALKTLIDVALGSHDSASLADAVENNLKDVADALQFIGDGDHENVMDAMFYGVWETCPEDMESHVLAVKGTFISVIKLAWSEYDEEVMPCLKWMLDIGKNTPEMGCPDDVAHLTKCLTL
jgi:hypothetical protein